MSKFDRTYRVFLNLATLALMIHAIVMAGDGRYDQAIFEMLVVITILISFTGSEMLNRKASAGSRDGVNPYRKAARQ
jgi:hypothetical protein